MKPEEAWNIAYSQMEIQFDRASFETWLRGAAFLGFDAGVFRVGVGNAYARDMLQNRLYRDVRRVVSDVWGERVELCFEVYKPPAPASGDEDLPLFRLLARQAAENTPLHQKIGRPVRPDLPESELNPRFTFQRFVVNSANRLTVEAALAVAESPASVYNPFLLYGGVGLGKTHLLQAIAHACRERGLRAIYIPSEAFTNDLVDAIRQKTTAMFRDKYRSADVLLVDDIQFIAGKESTQEEFFHTFNTLYTFNKQIVLASDRHPGQLHTLEDRLRSRFGGGLIMDLQPPEFETRLAILEMWADERGVKLPPGVAETIANRARTNVRELEGIFNQIVATSQLSRRALSVDVAQGVLDGYRRPRHHVTLARVLDVTARYHGVSVSELTGPRRTQKLTLARQIGMYLAREVTQASLPQIGEAFGGRAHSTVLHSCNKIAEDLESDELLRRGVETMQKELFGGPD
ncbi:MAG: chromosomal replication initiator protein DnaA [Chloroflexi bacterium]|nr:chromosomal replication initiator protein DnaA [Chloroflexota bacterium]MDL1885035.1 chromosomal replication initiator protein DnaA [Anaerolineae bacterium CFX8]